MTDSVELELFTPRMQRIVRAAQEIAAEVGVGKVGTEHILLALIRDGGGVAPQVLAEFADVDAVAERTWSLIRSPGYRGRPRA